MSDVFFDATYPKARKPHRCDQCERTIETGEKYRRQGGVYDGRMFTSVCCLQCEAFATVLHRAGFESDEGGWPWIAELDESEVAYCGFSHEFSLFKRNWRESNGLLVVPITSEPPARGAVS